jgi:chromosome segregation ATPase
MCENREVEITSLVNTNRELEKNNELQQEENKNLTINLKQLKDERTKNENECERLNKLLDDSLSTLKQLEKEARQLESTNCKLENVLTQAEKDHQQLLEELKTREQVVGSTNKKIEQLGEEEGELKEKITKLERECEKSKGEYQ